MDKDINKLCNGLENEKLHSIRTVSYLGFLLKFIRISAKSTTINKPWKIRQIEWFISLNFKNLCIKY